MSSAAEKAMDMITKRVPDSAPPVNKSTEIRETISLLKDLGIIGQPQPQPKSLIEQIAELVGNPVFGPMIRDFFVPKNPLDQLGQVTTLFDVIEKIRGAAGDGGGKKDWRAMLAEGAIQRGPDILKEIGELLDKNREAASERRAAAEANARAMEIARTMPPPGQLAAAAPVASAPQSAPIAAAPLRVVPLDNVAQPSPSASSPAAATIPAAEGLSQKDTDAVAAFMKKRIVEMLDEGRDAEDVVDFIDDVDPTVNNLLAEHTPDMVTMFLRGDPLLGKAVQSPNWKQFLSVAQEYIKEIRAEDAAIDAHATPIPS
jgi:hypothetical protein